MQNDMSKMKIKGLVMKCESIGSQVTIGKPVRKDGIQIGEVIDAENKGDYIEMMMELNEQGRKIYNEIKFPEQATFTFEVEKK